MVLDSVVGMMRNSSSYRSGVPRPGTQQLGSKHKYSPHCCAASLDDSTTTRWLAELATSFDGGSSSRAAAGVTAGRPPTKHCRCWCLLLPLLILLRLLLVRQSLLHSYHTDW